MFGLLISKEIKTDWFLIDKIITPSSANAMTAIDVADSKKRLLQKKKQNNQVQYTRFRTPSGAPRMVWGCPSPLAPAGDYTITFD